MPAAHLVWQDKGLQAAEHMGSSADSPLTQSLAPLLQVHWLPDAKHGNHVQLLSASTDGKILVWREERDGRLMVAEGFALVAQQIPRSAQLKKVSS